MTGGHGGGVLYHHPAARDLAKRWAHSFRLVEREAPPADHAGFYLWAVDDHLELRRGPGRAGGRDGVWVSCAELRRRSDQGGELARTCGAGTGLEVLDALAGWGVDGLVLARRGCRVTLVERHPMASALAQDLARRSGLEVVSRCADGFDVLGEGRCYDVVYLDPMFPARRKGALPGKRMQFLAALTTPDPRPLESWLDAAIAVARRRVVLKRRSKDPVCRAPDWQITGRTVRYDVYRGAPGESASRSS